MQQRDLGLAYVLLIFGGLLGVHRFYLGYRTSAALMFFMPAIVGFLVIAGISGGLGPLAFGFGLLSLYNPIVWIHDLFCMDELIQPKRVGRRAS